jgi:hypothetical protein
MLAGIDVAKIRHDLLQTRLSVERGKTMLEKLIEDEASEVDRVGQAKGRLLLKEDIENFLQIYQAEKYEQTVGLYRNLLSAIVHDVIDPNINIDLSITTSYGAPSLEVLAYDVNSPEHKVNVYSQCGGAMINVISAGLRTIAVARSGQRPFLILDEPDCWIRPDRVPAFFNVLQGLCRDLKFQLIVISHHPKQTFGDCHTISAVSGDDGLELTSPSTEDAWNKFDSVAFREVHYKDFAAIGDATLNLVPGLNVICGDNNIGKSRTLRGFWTAFYGGADDGDIRSGKTAAAVSFVQNDGLTLEYSRMKKRNPVNLWRLTKHKEVVVMGNDRCEAGGRQVPDWVGTAFAISNKNNMELQFSTQTKPVFGLDKPGSEQAALLQTGRETSGIRVMMEIHKDNVRADNGASKNGEKAIMALRQAIAMHPDYDEVYANIENGDAILDELSNDQIKIRKAIELSELISNTALFYRKMQVEIQILAELPADLPEIKDVSRLSSLRQEIVSLQERLTSLDQTKHILSQLPESEPELVELSRHISSIEEIDQLTYDFSQLQIALRAFDGLPDAVPEIKDVSPQRAAVKYLRDMTARLNVAKQSLELLDRLPTPPEIDEGAKAIREQAATIKARLVAQKEVSNRLHSYEAKMAEKEKVIADIREQVGDECPICSHQMGDILHKHDHHQDEKPAAVAPLVPTPAPLVKPPVSSPFRGLKPVGAGSTMGRS